MQGTKYSVSVITPANAPQEYSARALEMARREMGNKLYNILYSQKLPAVVDVQEIVIPASEGYYSQENQLNIEVTVMAVKHRHITMEYMDGWGYAPRRSFWKRIKKMLGFLY